MNQSDVQLVLKVHNTIFMSFVSVAAISESEMVVGRSLQSDQLSATTNVTGTILLCVCVCVSVWVTAQV